MSMLDFQGALAGAPPPGGAPAGAPPGVGAGLPPPEAGGLPLPPEEGPPLAPEEGGAAAGFATSLEALDAAEDALTAFITLDPDEADRVVAAQCLQNVIKLKASNAQSAESGDLKSLQRALQGGPAANAGPLGGAY